MSRDRQDSKPKALNRAQRSICLVVASVLCWLVPSQLGRDGQSLDPSKPAKEYIRMGGRVIAAETPSEALNPLNLAIALHCDSIEWPHSNLFCNIKWGVHNCRFVEHQPCGGYQSSNGVDWVEP